MNETYQTYINRVVPLTRLEHYQTQWPRIQSSPKFRPTPQGGYEPVPFPGYTLTTPPGPEDPKNTRFYHELQRCQTQLSQMLPDALGIPLPPDSFHLTVADLVWNGAYEQKLEAQADYEETLRQEMATVLAQQAGDRATIRLQVLGFMVMTRAISIALAPHTEADYDRILNLRQAIYQSPKLLALGIEQQYDFTAHITLGYFGKIPATLASEPLSGQLAELNGQFLESFPEFDVGQAELRKFDNMTHYYRQLDWPLLKF